MKETFSRRKTTRGVGCVFKVWNERDGVMKSNPKF